MASQLAQLAAVRQPFTVDDAAIVGVGRHGVARLARSGELHRVDRGSYVPAALWSDASPERRHLLRGRAVLRRFGFVALSHTSALIAHGLPTYGVNLDLVQSAGPAGSEALDLVRLGRGRSHAVAVTRLAGVCSDSPGETLTRLLLRAIVGEPVQQARIRLPDGMVARVDFLLPDLKVVVEFDGAIKHEGAQGRAALVRGKRREDGLRAIGYEVVRLTSPDLRRPPHVRTLLHAAIRRARRT